MNDDQSLERAARAWIEAGPTKAPEAAVEPPVVDRRDEPGPKAARPVAALRRRQDDAAPCGRGHDHRRRVGGAVLLSGGTTDHRSDQPSPAIASPGPVSPSPGSPTLSPSLNLSPTPPPSPPASFDLSTTFVSDRYGYSMSIAPDWVTRQATLTWFGPDNSSLVVDEFDITGTDTGLTGASEPLAPGQTLDQWLVDFQANAGGLSPPAGAAISRHGRVSPRMSPAGGSRCATRRRWSRSRAVASTSSRGATAHSTRAST